MLNVKITKYELEIKLLSQYWKHAHIKEWNNEDDK